MLNLNLKLQSKKKSVMKFLTVTLEQGLQKCANKPMIVDKD